MTDNESIYLVDGSSLAFRSFFALIASGLRRGSDGMPTWAIIGFFNALFEVIEKRSPHCMAIAFDLAAPTFRHEEFQDYKATRNEMPDDLSVQWPIIKEGVKMLGIPVYEIPGYEADDVIGTVAKNAEQNGMNCVILTGDQDSFQLLDESIQVLMPTTKEGVKTFGRNEVFEKLGVWPEQVVDYKGLVGDTSDNIPGVRGIGPKTAVQLLTDYKTIEGVYENLDKIKSNSVKTKLETGRESAFASKRLATIRLDVPVDFDFDHCRLKLPDVDTVVNYFRSVELNAILKRLPRILKHFNGGVEPEIDPALLEPVGKPTSRQRMNFKQGGTESGGSNGGAGGGTAVEPSTSRGGVAVAEQQRLDIAIPSKAPKVGAIGLPEPELIKTVAQLQNLKSELQKQQVLAVEVLTDSAHHCQGNIVGYAFAYSDNAKLNELKRPEVELKEIQIKTAYVPVRHKGFEEQIACETAVQELKPILEDERIGKVSFNAKLVTNALASSGINYGPLVFDPLLASYIVNPDNNHKIREQVHRVFGYSIANPADLLGTGKKQVTWDCVGCGAAGQYAVDVARMSLMLCSLYLQQMDDDQQELLFNMDLPLSTVLAKIEQNGVSLDTKYFSDYASELTSELTRLEGEIYELAGHSFNINSPLQLQNVLFKELKLPTKGKTKSGYSTDHSVLEALSEEHPIVQKILEYRQLSKLYSTYVESLPRQISERDNRLHGEFNQAATATGRLSSTNPNLQNIPIRTQQGQRIRRGFVPADENHLLLSADYSQIELRLLAHMSGDEKLIQAFRDDQDIHSRTAMDVFDVPADSVTSDHRRVGKTLNFALIYQQGAFATANQLGVSTKEAQGFIDKYFASYPKVRTFMSSTIDEARRNSYVSTLWGRRRYFKNLNDRNDVIRKADERAAANAPLQGSAADLIKLAMIRLDKDLREKGLGAKIILQVHDELVLDVPADEIEETKKAVQDAMGLDQPLRVPLKVDVGVGKNWMDAK